MRWDREDIVRAGIVVMLLGSVVLTQAAQGQAPAPATLDAVPDKMPFDAPYGAPVSLDRAQPVIAAAAAEAKKRDWKLNVAVVDSGGNLVAFARMDGAQLASVSISEHKARAAATFRRETKAFTWTRISRSSGPPAWTGMPGRRAAAPCGSG